MTFAHPKVLWLLALLLPALAAFLVWSWRRKQALIARFIHSRLVEQLLVGVSPARQKFRLALLFLSVLLLILALARPQWGYRWEESRQRGLDIIVAIDTSRSMLADDLKPNRLERAKLAALDLMQVARTDRLGLVAFAGSAFLQCPLTLDDDAFSQSVNALQAGIIPQGGTALGDTIETCLKGFNEDGDNYKVIVLITDGEDHDGGAVEAAKRAQKEGARIFTLGIGSTDGELLRVTGENQKAEFIRDPDGNIVKSRLNERLLQEIAGAADGFYLALQGGKTISLLYERGLAPLPRKDISDKLVRRSHDRFQWPLALALACLVLEVFFPERKSLPLTAPATASSALRQAVATLLLLLVPASLLASPASARREYDSGRYSEAQKEYQRLLDKKPDDDRLHYNAGAAAYRAEDYEAAARHFGTAKTSRDLQLQQRAFYNLANTLYRRGENSTEPDEKTTAWEDAIKNYDGALKLNPKDKDAEFNRELVKKRLEELKQQQEKQKQDQGRDGKDPKDKSDQGKPEDKSDGQNQPPKDQSQPDRQKQGDDKSKDQKPGKDEKKDGDKGKNDEQKQGDKQEGKQPDKDQAGKNQSPQKPGDKGDPASARQGGSQQVMLMNPEQAKQLLDSQKGEEKALIFQPTTEKPKSSNRLLKDW